MSRILIFILLFNVPCCAKSADWSARDIGDVVQLGHGAVSLKRQVEGPESVVLSLAIFDATHFSFRMMQQPPPLEMATSIADLLRPSKAVAGVNGGYFDTQRFTPSGLLISNGVSYGTMEVANPHEGTFLIKDGNPALLPANEIQTTAGVSELVQCSPMLVRAGKAVGGFGDESGPRLPRTFIATDGKNKWAIGVCRKTSLSSLARMLASPKVITEFKVERALNLDGGPSSGFWSRDQHGAEDSDKEGTRVQNIIAIFPRE